MSLIKFATSLGIEIPKYIRKRGDVAIYDRILKDLLKIRAQQTRDIMKTCRSIMKNATKPIRAPIERTKRRKSPGAKPKKQSPDAKPKKQSPNAMPNAKPKKQSPNAKPNGGAPPPPPPPPPPPKPSAMNQRRILMTNLKKRLKNMGLAQNQ
jgi:hypothetical protein